MTTQPPELERVAAAGEKLRRARELSAAAREELRAAILARVLSVSKLTPGQEGYYERSVAAGLDD